MRAILYARLSVNRSGETLAIERQLEDCQALADRNGWQVVATYTDDNRSAWHENSKRPGYDALCEAIRRRECDVVVVYETDRLARRLRTMLDLFDLLLDTGVVIHSVKSGLVALDSPMNIANAQMKAIFAEQYVNDARDKNLRARAQAAQQGKRHMTARVYGWEADGYTIRQSEAAIVREITRRLIDGHTGTRIARDLNQRGIRTGRGAAWTGIGVKALAKRASNAGLRSHHGVIYQGTWQAIVTREEWESVCRVLERPQTAYRRGRGRKYWLTSFTYCGTCGNKMAAAMGRGNSGHVALRCDARRSTSSERTGCGGVERGYEAVEWFVKEMLIRRLDTDAVREALEAAKQDDPDVTRLLDRESQLRARVDELVDSYALGVLSRTELARAKQVAETELEDVRRQIAMRSAKGRLKNVTFGDSIRETIENADMFWLMDLAEVLIDKVLIYPQPKRGWTVKWVTVNGKKRRFDPDLVSVEWLD